MTGTAKEDKGKVLISHEEILEKAEELGARITEDFSGQQVLLVGILKGSVPWMADLMKCIDLDVRLDFMICSSYGSSTESSGDVKIRKDLDTDVAGKNVIIVEDIIDTGITLYKLVPILRERGAADVRICSLLSKPARRVVDLEADYLGFEVPDRFIVGYGLDFDQKYRQLPYISCLDDTED